MNQLLYFATHPFRTIKNVRYRLPDTISDKKHIFIVGVPRSGTTLLKTILATHKSIGGSDWESTGIFGFRDIFQYRIGKLPPARVKLALNESPDIIAFYDRLVEELLVLKKKEVFVDKLQVRSYRIAYAQKYFPNSIFVHIVRDGRDCYCSALKHPNVRQSSSLTGFAKYWNNSVKLPDDLIPADRLLHLRYEDLTGDTEPTVRKLMEFVGLDFLEQQIDVGHFSSTSSMKKREVHKNLAKPISTRSQGKWKNEMTTAENDLFCSIAGKTLARHNYELKADEPDKNPQNPELKIT